MELQTRTQRFEVIYTDRLVLDGIRELNQAGETFSLEQLAEHVGCCRAAAANAVKRLKAAQRIIVWPGRGQGVRNRYEVRV